MSFLFKINVLFEIYYCHLLEKSSLLKIGVFLERNYLHLLEMIVYSFKQTCKEHYVARFWQTNIKSLIIIMSFKELYLNIDMSNL